MGIRRVRDEQGQPISDVREGADGVKVDQLYRYGRAHAGPGTRFGKPTQKDYAPREGSHVKPPTPHADEYAASYSPARNSDVSPAPDEQANQFVAGKVADHVDSSGWVRGMGAASPHPHFDSNVDNNGRAVSGARYSTK
jgi:hypothetical protein